MLIGALYVVNLFIAVIWVSYKKQPRAPIPSRASSRSFSISNSPHIAPGDRAADDERHDRPPILRDHGECTIRFTTSVQKHIQAFVAHRFFEHLTAALILVRRQLSIPEPLEVVYSCPACSY